MSAARDIRESSTALDGDEIGRLFREGAGRALAGLIRILGDIELAEDALQEAFAIALDKWPRDGRPDNPHAWIVKTARNSAVDRLRRESLGRSILADHVRDRAAAEEQDERALDPVPDDPLRLIFTCCHPALSQEAQVGLTLRLLGGLSTFEVARAFLVEETAMSQRIVRAKRKIKAAHIPYRVPSEDELPERLPPVLAVLYLIYNEGAGRVPRAGDAGDDLCSEAIRLTRQLLELLPNEPEVAGLLSLLLFNESRRASRHTADGSLVLLADQDRSAWNGPAIEEARDLLRTCIEGDRPGVYQLQASIQAVHADAVVASATNWLQIVFIYDQLLQMTRSPVVALNRAIAIGEIRGPAFALDLVDELELPNYAPFHATRAELLRRLERGAESASAYRRAAELSENPSERAFLEERAASVED